jgi:hypothetical protein
MRKCLTFLGFISQLALTGTSSSAAAATLQQVIVFNYYR